MAVKFQILDNPNHALLYFKAMQKLEFKEDTQKGYIKYGKDNLYPQELIRLYNEHPEHRAIVNRKARYIWGKGIKAVNEQDTIKVNAFIDSFNRFETLNEQGKRISTNFELFNGVYVQVITNLLGTPIEFYVLDSANCRLSECQKKLYYSKNWNRNTKPSEIQVLDKFSKDCGAGTFFIDFKYYTASVNYISSVYPTPIYQSVVNEINTDVDISTFNSNYVANGFSAGTIISFFNGHPTDEQIADIKARFDSTYSGESNAGKTLITHNDNDGKAPEVTSINVDDLDKKFEFTAKRCQKKIFSGHEMAPELFNTKFDDSFLSSAPDLLLLQDLFVKGYIEPRQTDLLDFLSYLSYLKTGEYLQMMFEPISLIGKDLSNDTDLTQDERRKLKGYEPIIVATNNNANRVLDSLNSLSPLVATKVLEVMTEDEIRGLGSLAPKNLPKLDANGQPVTVQAANTNDNLKGLSAADNADMYRIVRDYSKGKINEHLAITRLTAYGIDEIQAKKILGIEEPVKMSSNHDDKILMALEKCGRKEDPSTYTVIKREKVNFKSSIDALKYERQIMKFADALVISIEDLDTAVLTALKGNPNLTVDELAKIINVESYKIEEALTRLIDKGLLIESVDGFNPTEKANNIPNETVETVEVYTVYKYEVDPERKQFKPGGPGKSRKFCTTLMRLDKEYDFEEIDGLRLEGMENVGGTNIWDYRGGFYNNWKTGVIEPDCRHIWVAETRARKKKK